jgi:hypothetical protein
MIRELGPNDFDFEVFRAEISNAIVYNLDTKDIYYSYKS